jgi:hydroxyacyl-ACP dehydratase HTD2-like protein with hotdog domain
LLQATELAASKGSEEVRCTMQADEVLLFRYSALTFNSHKIHYDRRHCVEVEKYPGLIVHGPLMACLMGTLAWFQAATKRPGYFAFRALSPVFDGDPVEVVAKHSRSLTKESLLFSQLSSRGYDLGMQGNNGNLEQAFQVTDCAIEKADGSLAMQAQMAW